MQSSRLVLVAASLSLSLGAQTVTGSAVAQQDCNVRAEHFSVAPPALRTFDAGADMTPGCKLDARSGVATGSFTFSIAQGPVTTFTANVRGMAVTFGDDNAAMVSSDADFLLSLDSTAPVYGALTIDVRAIPSNGAPGLGNFRVDVDNNGTFEVTGNPDGTPVRVEIPVAFGPWAQTIRVVHTGSVSVPMNFIGDYGADLSDRWTPVGGTMTSYGSPCGSELNWGRKVDGTFRLFLSPPATPATWYLFGDTQTQIPLNLPPYCTLLTDTDYVLASGGNFYLDLPLLPLPPGFAMNVQAVTFAPYDTTLGLTLLSNGLRLFQNP